MDSSTLIFVAGVLLLTLILLAILYFLYKYLISETPYQRTLLIDQIDSKGNDKKAVKKVKNNLRQRNVAKSGDEGSKKGDGNKGEKTEVKVEKVETKSLKSDKEGKTEVKAAEMKKKASSEKGESLLLVDSIILPLMIFEIILILYL